MNPSIIEILAGQPRDIGGLVVRRSLPQGRRRSIGPFIFWDEMGPAEFSPGVGLDVRPHPHIGLATLTYLFEGEIVHRDSLGVVQPIRPGAVNWMTAGRGVVHSERTGPETRARGHRLHGIQSWLALPVEDEELEPSFAHHPEGSLPEIDQGGAKVRIVVGSMGETSSPVVTRSPTIYLDVHLDTDAELILPNAEELAVYPISGSTAIGATALANQELAVVEPGTTVTASSESRLIVMGGRRLRHPRTMWWNLVSVSPQRIDQAREDWRDGRFPPVPGDDEFIPLPE